MQVTNLQNNARTLGRDQCDDGLESEIRGCQYGGQSDKSGWRYRLVVANFKDDLGERSVC